MTQQHKATHDLIGELQILQILDPLKATILKLEIDHRTGSLDTAAPAQAGSLLGTLS